MKKPRPDPPLSSIKSDRALLSIWAALEKNLQQLCARLRAGIASNAEQALAADLLEGKTRPRRPRPMFDRLSRFQMAVAIHFLEGIAIGRQIATIRKVSPDWNPSSAELEAMRKALLRKRILADACKMVGDGSRTMKERRAYYTLKEFDGAAFAALSQCLVTEGELDHDTLVQIAQSALARK